MPLRPFSWIEKNPEKNQKTLDENTKTGLWIVPFTDFESGGSPITTISNSDGTTPFTGTWVLYGPLVYFTLNFFLPSGDEWLAGATITLPYSIVKSTGSTIYKRAVYPVYQISGTSTLVDYVILGSGTVGNKLVFQAGHTAGGVSGRDFVISGWYLRN